MRCYVGIAVKLVRPTDVHTQQFTNVRERVRVHIFMEKAVHHRQYSPHSQIQQNSFQIDAGVSTNIVRR